MTPTDIILGGNLLFVGRPSISGDAACCVSQVYRVGLLGREGRGPGANHNAREGDVHRHPAQGQTACLVGVTIAGDLAVKQQSQYYRIVFLLSQYYRDGGPTIAKLSR